MDPVDAVLRFLERINAHDVKGMVALMTADHLFVDSLGEQVTGREAMREAWTAYFFLFPDFSIHCAHMFRREDELALFGTAEGTYVARQTPPRQSRWKMPAAWRAVVRDGLIAEWRVYADNEPVRRLMAEDGRDR